jgi:hypothetical protein
MSTPDRLNTLLFDASNLAAEGSDGIENSRDASYQSAQLSERTDEDAQLSEGHRRDANDLRGINQYAQYAMRASEN